MEQFATKAETTLAEAIDDSQTEFDVVAAPIASGTYRIIIDSEIMTVTGVSSNTLTVQRGTSPAAHSNGAVVKHILTATGLTSHLQNDLVQVGTYNTIPALPRGGVYLPKQGRFALTPPIGVFDTWINQQSLSADETKGYLVLTAPTSTPVGTQIYGKALGANTTFTALLSAFSVVNTSIINGISWYRSPKVVTFGFLASGVTYIIPYLTVWQAGTVTTSTVTIRLSMYHTVPSGRHWLRSSISGTTLTYQYSYDGVFWHTAATASATTDLGGAPTHVGIGRCSTVVSSAPWLTTVYHWAEA